MKIVHADEIEWKRGLQHRGGTFHYRHLLEGNAGTPGNFHLGIGQQDGDFASPRHRHNFDQFRFQIEGTMDFDRNGKMAAGTLGYFPEGAAYGPQTSEGRSVTAVLQFGGASGSGYLSPAEVAATTEELKKFGTLRAGSSAAMTTSKAAAIATLIRRSGSTFTAGGWIIQSRVIAIPSWSTQKITIGFPWPAYRE
jgi:hypothetical protein